MKKIVMLTVLLVTAFTVGAQEKMLIAFLDGDPPYTHIVNKPSGATVMTLPYDEAYIFSLTSPQDGWWKINDLWNAADDEDTTSLAGSDTGEYWIHFSALGLGTSNYGGQELYLRAAPHQDADIVFTFNQELTLMPLDVDGDWIKVQVDGYDIVGWIENEWLCSNPLTNCC